ncbi:helix-turn-helix transcriptional regulator [Streptomyces melanogenes]|uniref:helix-turn-helix transcriptional regulator n=1 Tax=Streptomyces melanogenes TaxID=67326 RepID=UPI00378AEE89
MSTASKDCLSICVGREGDLGLLEEALDRALRGHGTAILLTGEEGAGKSRLVREVAESARGRAMRVLLGRSSPVSPAVPLRPLSEALACLFRDGEGPDSRTLGPYRAILGRVVPEYAHVRLGTGRRSPGLREGEGTVVGCHGPEHSPVLLAESVLRLVSAAGAGSGSLLVLEDLHDADPATLAVVEYLADNIAGQGTVLLATFRSGPGAPWDLARALARRRAGTLLTLRGLSRTEVARLAASRLGIGSDGVPYNVVERLYRDSGGNLFVAEELLRTLVASGALVTGPQGCRLVAGVRCPVPAAVEHSIARRAARLGPEGHRLLSAAAVIGERFPVSVLRQAWGLSEARLFARLRAAGAAGLITADDRACDWYGFRGALTAAALLGQLTPADRAAVARRTAEAVAELHPGLPGPWCPFAAELRLSADDRPGAASLFATAGRRALSAGRVSLAVEQLTRAWELLCAADEPRVRVDVLDELLAALSESGRADHGLRLASALEELDGPGVAGVHLARLHTRLAWLSQADGQPEVGLAHVDAARCALGPQAEDRHTAPLDAVEAQLTVHAPPMAGRLAEQATDKAERAGLTVVACRAWRVRGQLALMRGSQEASHCFTRMHTLADAHELPLWRMHAMLQLAGQHCLVDGERDALLRVRRQAGRIGARAVHTSADLILALDHVLRGEYPEARQLTDAYRAREEQPGFTGADARCLAAVRAIGAAHQGRRDMLEKHLGASLGAGAPPSPWASLARGLGGVVCALLEEDRDLARLTLERATAEDAVHPAPYPLTGQYGLALLLEALTAEADPDRPGRPDPGEAGRLRWNRQFVLLARAVRLGRYGRGEEAADAVVEAEALAQPYPPAAHLGLRLVAEAAQADGWGEPVLWLRAAEQYFHGAGVAAVAGACRSLLRRAGAVVPHRTGDGQVPQVLRVLGVTPREYEVLRLLADRLDNRALAARLCISPRTVEKHVASLISKCDQPNRAALNAYAARIRQAEGWGERR